MSELDERLGMLSPEKRALLLERLKAKGKVAPQQTGITRREERESYPLSFAQQRLWFLDQLEPGGAAYNIPAAVRLTGELDVAALERSLSEIVRRHEALRTTFRAEKGDAAQVIGPAAPVTLAVSDLSGLAPGAQEGEARRLATEEAKRPFDLTRGPLMRAGLLRLAAREHVLLLTMHHIVSDGWSVGVFIRELGALYEAFVRGAPSPLGELPIRYVDHAMWQQERVGSDGLKRQLEYWRQRLGDLPPALELPTDRPRPSKQSTHGAHYAYELPAALGAALRALSHDERTTLFATLLAAFQVLLHRYSSQEDISVGTPVANRAGVEAESLIGLFVNTVVIRSSLSGRMTFRELLAQMRESTVAAQENQDLPFETLVEALQPARDLSHTPLFQVMFGLDPAPLEGLRLADLAATLLPIESGTSKFELTLSVEQAGDRLTTVWEYNTDLFLASTVARMARHFHVLLEAVAANPGRRISTLPILTDAELQQLVFEWNDTSVEYPADQCMHQLFEAQAERTPDAVAVVWPAGGKRARQQLTYAELNRRANQLAHYLRCLGAGPEMLVGLSVRRSPDLAVGLLGILKAGAAYLPLDPSYPPERLDFMLQDAGVSLVVTQSEFRFVLPTAERRLVCLDSDWPAIALQPDRNPDSGATPDNLAYVIYTSGSTGRPKGVLVPHRGVVNHNSTTARRFRLQPEDRVLQFATINFDAAVEEIFPTWHAGATLVLRPDDLLTSGQELTRLVHSEGLTLLDFPTAFWHEWVSQLESLGSSLPSSVRLVVVGGDKASPERFAAWLKVGGAAATWMNTYGPTEATIIASLYETPRGLDRWDPNEELPIGRPIANMQLYVLDRYLQPAPVGTPGELYIGGVGVARGYLSRPDVTAERFVPDPFSGVPGARLYKTGDLVRSSPAGTLNLEFVGRADHQVKVRGFRIELGEIEETLRKHPAIRETVVVAQETAPGARRLVGYVVCREGMVEPSAAELRRHVLASLPDYMVPAAWVFMEALPLTPSAKIDRRALPAPPPADARLESGTYAAPRNLTEEILAGIWAGLLGVERVGINDNFFELGGHSLSAMQLVSRIGEAFKVEIPLRDLFESPTVAGLAESIDRAVLRAAGRELPPIVPVARDGAIPLSFAQQRLWFLDQLEPGSPLYNIASATRLTGKLNAEAFERALNAIVARHESLRTSFVAVEGKSAQVIAKKLRLRIPIIDLRALRAQEREAEAMRLAVEEARLPFDLATGPLVRAQLIRMRDHEHILLLTMHHIVSDGWSMGVVVRELAVLYDAFTTDGSEGAAAHLASLPALPVAYPDYAAWQRGWLETPGPDGESPLEKQLAYWRKQLDGAPPLLDLPTDRARPPVQSYLGALHTFSLPEELSRRLRELSRQEGTTLFMTLLAGFQALLHRYSGQIDISVGIPIANRRLPELEELVGFFVNTLVVRSNLSGAPSFRELLRRVRETAMEAYAHQDTPFEMVVDAVQPVRNLSHTPLFQAVFALQNAPMQSIRLADLTISQLESDTGTAKFDLTLAMSEEAGLLQGALEYSTELFDGATIERMARNFRVLLEGIAADPELPISALPLLDAAEREKVLAEWNATARDFSERPVHEQVAAHARRAPDSVALIFEGQRISYYELDRRANQVAHTLRGLGVGPETLVGICVDRSPEMLAGVLGILKAGGAYVPLDPAHPQDRLDFILEDTRLRVLLTQEHLAERFAPAAPPDGGGIAGDGLQMLLLDRDRAAIEQMPDSDPGAGVLPQNLAYVIFTSGSTGRPKGTLLEHRGLSNLVEAYTSDFSIGPGDRVLQFFSFGFDASVLDFFSALTSGAALCLVSRDTTLSMGDLHRVMKDEGITLTLMPPSALSMLSNEGLDQLRTLLSGGEACNAEIISRWAPGRQFVNAYGPTEATVAVTWYELDPSWSDTANIPIGRPIANTQAYVLDRELRPAPIGVPGELYFGGIGLARGYHERPELTADRFIPDPFSGQPGARLYRTGDLVRYLPDGNIQYLGRTDFQVKVRGFRIELGEIEHVLRQHPDVREVVVMAREDTPGSKRLVAYLVTEDAGDAHEGGKRPAPAVADLRAFIAQKLPEYMVPAAFVMLDAMPLNANGKVDRRALPAPASSEAVRVDLQTTYAAPNTPAEEILASVWAQVLGVPRVGIHDNFFELGGDSILSIQVIARAHQAGLHLTPKQLFQSPTVAALAAKAVADHAEGAAAITAEQEVVEGPAPLTPIQRWFFEHEFAQPNHWNQAVMLVVQGGLEPEPLRRALAALLEHHDALRLRYARNETDWHQRVSGIDDEVPLEVVDLSGLPEAERRAAIEARASAAQDSLDIAGGPLLRAVHFRLGEERPSRLLVVAHHLAIDGVSWRILLEDLEAAYGQASRGEAVRLPPKTTSFRTWARKLTEYADAPEVQAQAAHWLEVASDGGRMRQPPQLPLDRAAADLRRANTEASAAVIRVAFTADETQALLRDVPATYGTEINEVLLTALASAVRGWTGSRSVLIDLEGHGREDLFRDVDISRTVGWFTTMYPVRLELPEAGGTGEALKSIKEQVRRTPQRGIGFGLLRYAGKGSEAAERLRTLREPQISFNYLGQFDQVFSQSRQFSLADESAGPSLHPDGARSHLIDINGGIAEGCLRLDWTYSRALHSEDTMRVLTASFSQALRSLIAHCRSADARGYTPSDFQDVALTQDELDGLLAELEEA